MMEETMHLLLCSREAAKERAADFRAVSLFLLVLSALLTQHGLPTVVGVSMICAAAAAWIVAGRVEETPLSNEEKHAIDAVAAGLHPQAARILTLIAREPKSRDVLLAAIGHELWSQTQEAS